jgi:probable HAF family extracellular repeat protein
MLTGSNGESSSPSSINIFGQVVRGFVLSYNLGQRRGITRVLASTQGANHRPGHLWGHRNPILSDPDLVVGALGNAIHDLSQIVGVFAASDGIYHSFLTQPGGTKSKDIGSLGDFA